jgi:hypothetical protein
MQYIYKKFIKAIFTCHCRVICGLAVASQAKTGYATQANAYGMTQEVAVVAEQSVGKTTQLTIKLFHLKINLTSLS